MWNQGIGHVWNQRKLVRRETKELVTCGTKELVTCGTKKLVTFSRRSMLSGLNVISNYNYTDVVVSMFNRKISAQFENQSSEMCKPMYYL